MGNDSVYKSFHFSSRDPVDKELDGGKTKKNCSYNLVAVPANLRMPISA